MNIIRREHSSGGVESGNSGHAGKRRPRLLPTTQACLFIAAWAAANNARSDVYPPSGGIFLSSGTHVYSGSGTVNVTGTNALNIAASGSDTSATISPDGGSVTLSSNVGVLIIGTAGKNSTFIIEPGDVNIIARNANFAIAVTASATPTTSSLVQIGSGVHIATSGSNGYGLWSTSFASIVADGVTINTTGPGGTGAGVVGNGTLELTNSTIDTTGNSGIGLVNLFSHGEYLGHSALEVQNVSLTTHGNDSAGAFLQGSGSTFFTNVVGETYGPGAPGVISADGADLLVTSDSSVAGAPSSFITVGADSPALMIVNSEANETTVNANRSTFHASGPQSYGALLTGVAGSTEVLTAANTRILSDQSDAIRVEGPLARISLSDGSVVTAGAGSAALNVVATADGPGEAALAADNSTLTGSILTDAASTSNVSLTGGSTWNVTGNSVLTNLTNDASTIAFSPSAQLAASPQDSSSYYTINVRGNYAGNNGALTLNSFLNAGGPLTNQFTDRLLIDGDATGTTTVTVKAAPGSTGGLTSPAGVINRSEGISIIQVAGTSTSGAFGLAGGYVTAPDSPYQYRLYAYGPASAHGDADPAQSLAGNASGYWDYRLQSAYVTPDGPVVPNAPDETEPNPPSPPAPEEEVDVPADARLAVAPQVASYLSAPAAILYAGFADLDTLHRRLGEIRDDQNLGRDKDGPGEVFIRGYGGHFNYSSNVGFSRYGYDASGDYSAVQFGANVFRHRDDNDGIWRFGLAATLGWLHFVPAAVDGNSSTRTDTFRLAGYGTYQSQRGWYVDGILSAGWFDGTVSTDARGQAFSLRGTGYAASLETGFPFYVGHGFNVEPQAQLVGQHIGFRNDTDADGLAVNIGSQNQLLGRLGVRLTRPYDTSKGRITPYAAVDVLHAFTGGTSVQVGNANFTSGDYGDALQMSLGVNSTVTNKLSLYGRVSWQHSLGNAGFQGWLFNGGARILF